MNKKSKTTNNKTVKKKSNSKSLKNDLLETKDKYLRLYSEFENYRRRTSKEKVEMINSANKELISLILPVIDDFERAIKLTSKENLDTSMEGFELIFQKLNSLLEKQGVKKMEIKTGDDFDPDFHEAITKIASKKNLKDKIVDVIENGYMLDDKVIRFAKVVTGS
jgi:molecular chaperone GrpE|tara:strand:- start:37 stop:531 length:495 start_codon:yes stop_codon:yes gene_type:complete